MSEQNTTELGGQWAVVTGASKGIGFGIARALAGAGASVVLVARGEEALAEAARKLRAQACDGQLFTTMSVDTADPAAIHAMFDRMEVELPQLNIYVANAGYGTITPFLDLRQDEWDSIVALNLTGTFVGCQRAARMMTRTGRDVNSSILVVSSVRATGARAGRLPYSATKAGLNQLVRVAALELAEHNVRVNAVSPGITATPMALENNPVIFAEAAAGVPMGRAATPADIGAAAVYLCSPAAQFVTGANIVIDGGESLS